MVDAACERYTIQSRRPPFHHPEPPPDVLLLPRGTVRFLRVPCPTRSVFPRMDIKQMLTPNQRKEPVQQVRLRHILTRV